MSETPAPIAEIEHGPSKFEEFLENNQGKMIILAILIALGVVGYVVWRGLAESAFHDAGTELVKAQSAAEFKEVINKHPNTPTAASAMMLLATEQASEKPEEAISTLNSFLDEFPDHPAAETASMSLAFRLLETGKKTEAIDKFNEIASSESYISPLAMITLGDLAKADGNADQAKSWFDKAIETKNPAYTQIAKEKLERVYAKPPTKIAPALPETPETEGDKESQDSTEEQKSPESVETPKEDEKKLPEVEE